MRRAAMGFFIAATSGFLVLFLSVSVAQRRNGLTYISAHVCALRGSTVDLRCVYRQPSTIKRRSVTVEKILWFTEMQDKRPVDLRTDSSYAGRVSYYCDKTTCTLRIRDLRESDSSEYKFTFKNKGRKFTASPGVTLSVTDPDLQVQVRRSYSIFAELFCHSLCHLPERPSYIWYKNGQEMQEVTSPLYSDYFDPADSYSCALRGHEDFPAPVMCVIDQTCNRVMYTNRSICVPKGSSVDISCTYNSNEDQVESKFWFSPEHSQRWQSPSQPEDLSEDAQFKGRVSVFERVRGSSTLRISDLTERDSAEYRFKFRTRSFEWRSSLPGTTLTVTALQVQVIRLSVNQSQTYAELKCHSSCSPAGRLSYVWFKNGQKMQEQTSFYTDNFHLGDNISCAFKGHEDQRSPSVYAPKFLSVSVSPSAEILEGSSVNLTCSGDANPAANYTWYKEHEDSPEASGQNFTISDFRAEYTASLRSGVGAKLSCFLFVITVLLLFF